MDNVPGGASTRRWPREAAADGWTPRLPTDEQAAGFAADPGLKASMARAGVAGPPQIDTFTVA